MCFCINNLPLNRRPFRDRYAFHLHSFFSLQKYQHTYFSSVRLSISLVSFPSSREECLWYRKKSWRTEWGMWVSEEGWERPNMSKRVRDIVSQPTERQEAKPSCKNNPPNYSKGEPALLIAPPVQWHAIYPGEWERGIGKKPTVESLYCIPSLYLDAVIYYLW